MEKDNKKKTGRLFFAIVPGSATQQSLYKFSRMIRLDGAEKVTPPDKLHITLRYIGPVDASTCECLIKKADNVDATCFSIQLSQLNYWKKPQITWCGPDTMEPLLQQLVNQLEAVCNECGISAEKREYQPHVTLLRKSLKRSHSKLPEVLSWKVGSFVLIESISTSSGVEYRVLKKWLLAQ